MSQSRTPFPTAGLPADEIERVLALRVPNDVHLHWSRAARATPEVDALAHRVYDRYHSHNGIFSLRVEYMRHLESEVTDMCVDLLHGPPEAAGTFTSGGSESIYSALHAMREWARETHPDIHEPELLAPYTAHPSFSRGCHYLGLKLVRVAVGADLRASVAAMEQAITPRTIGLVGSAPGWSYGRYDPIGSLGALAEACGLWLHVDACVGGYLAPFAEELGVALPRWDFRIAGVRSISADLHKYAYCLKSASTILWRSKELLRYHYVHPADWPGGRYATAGFQGSRSAGAIFAAWAVLKNLGREGYLRLTRQVLATKARVLEGVAAIPGLAAFENDLLPVVFAADGVDLTRVKAEMSARGWILLGSADPPLIALPIDPAADESVIEAFLSELADATARARTAPGAREELRY